MVLPVKLCDRPGELIVETEGTEGRRTFMDDCVFLGVNTHFFVHITIREIAKNIQRITIDSVIAPGMGGRG